MNNTTSFAQIKAVTETGDEVFLYTNGTWKYKESVKNNDSVTTNTVNFYKPSTANFLLKSKVAEVGFWLNSKKWNFEKSTDNSSEFSFSLKENSAVLGSIVVESFGMELSSLRKFAIKNIEEKASAFKIVHEEYRIVNGLKLLLLQMDATLEGINFSYFNYYYSDSLQTVQLLAFTSKNLIAKFAPALEEMLNGFVLLNSGTSQGKDIIQSSLVANSNCKALFTGTWSYIALGKKYVDRIVPKKMLETSNDGYKSEYQMRWIDSCTYELKLQSSNEPAAKLMKIGAPILVQIMAIDAESMRYQLKYNESFISGDMKREK